MDAIQLPSVILEPSPVSPPPPNRRANRTSFLPSSTLGRTVVNCQELERAFDVARAPASICASTRTPFESAIFGTTRFSRCKTEHPAGWLRGRQGLSLYEISYQRFYDPSVMQVLQPGAQPRGVARVSE